MNRPYLIFSSIFFAISSVANAQNLHFEQRYESQLTSSDGATPLWLNANKQGLSSLANNNGYLRAATIVGAEDSLHNYGWSSCADLVVPQGFRSQSVHGSYTDHIILQQAYLEGRYKLGSVMIGAKERSMELKDSELSSGSQTLGINARPVPQVRIGLAEYWRIPGLGGWLSMKVHAAYGVMTDGGWQETFACGTQNKYNKWTRYHEKAGYLRIGNEERFPLTLTLGLEMASQFGGELYGWKGTDQTNYQTADKITLASGMSSYINAMFGTGADNGETTYSNAEGNILGSWVARLNWDDDNVTAGLYADMFFEDHSSMFHLDYDGYGDGDKWNSKEHRRMFFYPFKDILAGVDVKWKRFPFVNKLVVEYMNTTYQSGPIYHDHTSSISDHLGGVDDYYNHSRVSGWQHWGQVIGNPLYRSPQYNDDGFIGVKSNRFRAWNFGVGGDPVEGLHYRVRLSWQRSWGRYLDPFYYTEENVSTLVEASYSFPKTSMLKGMTVTAAWGADYGKLLGDNSGLQFGVRYVIKSRLY